MEIGGGSDGVEGNQEKRKGGCLQEFEKNGDRGEREMMGNKSASGVEEAWG